MNVCVLYKGEASLVKKYIENAVYYHIDEYDQIRSVFSEVNAIILDFTSGVGYSSDSRFIAAIREITTLPILLVLGSHESAMYREEMIDAGADGCAQLPFMGEELLARLQKLIKKKESLLFTGTVVRVGEAQIDMRTHAVRVSDKNINLTKTEYGILLNLFLRKRSVVRSEDLQRSVSDEMGNDTSSLNVHILNIRKKTGLKDVIRTVPNYGFMASEVAI